MATLETELKNLRVVRGKHSLKSILNSNHLKKMGSCGEFKYFIAQDSLMSSI